jgi:hypothetical protein
MEQLDSRELLRDTRMMYKLHDSAMNVRGSLEYMQFTSHLLSLLY